MSAAPRRAKKAKAPVLKLVEQRPLADVVGCLQELLGDALRGDLVGLAFAAQYRGQMFEVDCAGEAWTNPTFAAGMTLQLADSIGRRARGE